jgi:hypothetical protein
VYNVDKDSFFLRNLNIKNIEISKNDILKSYGHGVHLYDVKTNPNDPKRIVIRNNLITELSEGYGIFIENSSCNIE